MEKTSKNKKDKPSHVIFSEKNAVASATECTGLIQIPPTNEEEAKAYTDLYSVPEQINHSLKK